MNWSKDAKKYIKEVPHIIEEKSISVFPNIGSEQAAIVMTNLFKHATDHIYIFSHSFSGDFSNHKDCLSALEVFLSEKKQISVLLEAVPDTKSLALQTIENYLEVNSDKGEIKKLSVDARNAIKESFKDNRCYHFAVADDEKYRVELNSETKESLSSFRHSKVANSLNEIFVKAFKLSESINPQ